MLHRPKGDSPAEQQKKYEAHKAAHVAIKQFCGSGQYFTAFVVAYALLEDRLIALRFIAMRAELVRQSANTRAKREIKTMSNDLCHCGVINVELRDEVLNLADMRNKIVHSAMYNLDRVSKAHVRRVMDATRSLQSIGLKLVRRSAALKPTVSNN